jgi:cell division protease FtsH
MIKGLLMVCLFGFSTSFLRKFPIKMSVTTFLNFVNDNDTFVVKMKHPLSKPLYEEYIKRLNSKNISIQNSEILGDDNYGLEQTNKTTIKIFLNKNILYPYGQFGNGNEDEGDLFDKKDSKSKNFEVIKKFPVKFSDIGGYDKVKLELMQSIDILVNYEKYEKYNVRTPKGLILEGPPGNGKTLLAKGFAGEANIGFIPVSGSEFQEKYVGVGSSRVRELYKLAMNNKPCIIFIDEIDAIGRSRSSESDSSNSERDNTLNELLVCLDGFKSNAGVFTIGATNRIDLLDKALLRPGRIDKSIFIGLPDSKTRESIIEIHIKGKPYDTNVSLDNLIEITSGLSGAQIENLLNEGMLNALRFNRTSISNEDIDSMMNRIMAGWQSSDHQFTSDIIDHIAIHELGHAIVGLMCIHHSKMKKVIINLSSPKTPGYTVFENQESSIYTREALFEHLMILLAGRIAEEVIYDATVTTGAINDFEEAYKLAEKMIIYYGMGKNLIYPRVSEKYKEAIDVEIIQLINSAYSKSLFIVQKYKAIIIECLDILKEEKILLADKIISIIENK